MKVTGIVKVEHQFTYETKSDDRKEIVVEIEDHWNALIDIGEDEEKYHDTEYDYREIYENEI